jgi:spore coat polysaccharide biosynthesis protein SpsF
MNLRALRLLYPDINLTGVEINAKAANELRQHVDRVEECSILDWEPQASADLALIKTVLIHINPDRLNDVYDRLYRASNRLVLICEFYNPTPVEVNYRGYDGKLFKRDFAGEMLDRFPDLRLLNYGFLYSRDPAFLNADQCWFLLEKS